MQNFAKLFLNLSVISVGFEAFIHVLRCDLFLPYLLRYQIFSGLIADNGFFKKKGEVKNLQLFNSVDWRQKLRWFEVS